MTSDKEPSTFYVKKGIRESLVSRGINASQIVDHFLRLASKELVDAQTSVDLVSYKAIRAQLQLKESHHIQELQKDIKTIKKLQERIGSIDQKIDGVHVEIADIKFAEELASLMRSLSQKVRESKYNIELLKKIAAEELHLLREKFNLRIDDAWLRRHAQRIEFKPKKEEKKT